MIHILKIVFCNRGRCRGVVKSPSFRQLRIFFQVLHIVCGILLCLGMTAQAADSPIFIAMEAVCEYIFCIQHSRGRHLTASAIAQGTAKLVFGVWEIAEREYYKGIRVFAQSSELGPPPPPTQASVAPLQDQVVGATLACEGVALGWGGGANSDEWTVTLLLYIVFTPLTVNSF